MLNLDNCRLTLQRTPVLQGLQRVRVLKLPCIGELVVRIGCVTVLSLEFIRVLMLVCVSVLV